MSPSRLDESDISPFKNEKHIEAALENYAQLQLCDVLIEDENDYWAGLEVLHPKMHQYMRGQHKKLQRKIEILELKQPVVVSKTKEDTESDNAQVKVLQRVNKELKRQVELYKEEVD